MKEQNKNDEKSSVIKDYIQGILFLLMPIVVIYLIIKYF